jgi:hypothetical protein
MGNKNKKSFDSKVWEQVVRPGQILIEKLLMKITTKS